MDLPTPTIRPARQGDLPAIRALEGAYGNLDAWPERPDFLDHELAAGRAVVAEAGGEVVAFAGVFEQSGITYLADAFVRRDLLGRGLGRAVVGAVLAGAGTMLTSASHDPRALPLYARFGMRPVLPLLYLSGTRAAAAALAGADVELREPGGALADAVRLDAGASARERPHELAFLAATPGGRLLLALDAARAVGYGAVRAVVVGGERHAFLGPVGAVDEDAMDRTTRELVRTAAERAARVHVAVLGPHPSLAALLEAGFRIVDRDTVMCTRLDLLDGTRYAPNPDLG